jgi:hypothetical protein
MSLPELLIAVALQTLSKVGATIKMEKMVKARGVSDKII